MISAVLPLLLLGVLRASALVADYAVATDPGLPPYIRQCSRRDPKLNSCYVDALMHIRPWLAEGIPEISVPSTEPFRMVELSLSLTEGPGGYRVTLQNIDVTGVSNYSVRDLTLGNAGTFSLEVMIAELQLVANYSSSGVLIMIPASGRGTLYGVLGRVRAQLRGTTSVHAGALEDQRRARFLHVDRLNVDLKVRDVSMRIERGAGENPIIARATNLLLRTSGHLVLDAMMPELRLKLADVFLGIANNIFSRVPVESLLRD